MTTKATKKWTPGPWRVHTSGRGLVCVASDDAWICGELDNQPQEMPTSESTANAHLIAAAPRMADYIIKRAQEGDAEAREIIDDIL